MPDNYQAFRVEGSWRDRRRALEKRNHTHNNYFRGHTILLSFRTMAFYHMQKRLRSKEAAVKLAHEGCRSALKLWNAYGCELLSNLAQKPFASCCRICRTLRQPTLNERDDQSISSGNAQGK